MNSTQITTPLPDVLKSRLAKGHVGGKEISSLAFIPEVIQPAGAVYSSANDLLPPVFFGTASNRRYVAFFPVVNKSTRLDYAYTSPSWW
jgi:hypothetical protein